VIRFFVLFFAVLAGLSLLSSYKPIYFAAIEPWNGMLAQISYWFMHWFDADVAISDNTLYSLATNEGVRVMRGCNGVEAIIVLAAAILAFPTTVRAKALGLVIGALAVQGLNVVRIISLYYLNMWNHDLFEWTHLYLWQILIILDAFIFFVLWLRWLPKPQPA
jgi:exosortase H (IPTLxxWG-CTERM-specific)